MAFTKRKDIVDTPFDDGVLRARNRTIETDEAKELKAHYMTTRSALFLACLILGMTGNINTAIHYAYTVGVVAVTVLLWSITFRFLKSDKFPLINGFVSLVLSLAVGYGLEYFILHYVNVFSLVIVAIGLALLGSMPPDGHSFKRTRFIDEILLPLVFAISSTIFGVGAVCVINCKADFVSTIISVLVLVALSYLLTFITKRNYYMTSRLMKDVKDIPVNVKEDLKIFISTKTVFMIACFVAFAISALVQALLNDQYLFSLVLMPLVTLLLFCFYPLYSKSAKSNAFGVATYAYECIFMSYLIYSTCSYFYIEHGSSLVVNFFLEEPLLVILSLLSLVASDMLVTGLFASYKRKLIFSQRLKHSDGMPFYLLVVAMILMIGSLFYVIY